jgi:hypothetical protein
VTFLFTFVVPLIFAGMVIVMWFERRETERRLANAEREIMDLQRRSHDFEWGRLPNHAGTAALKRALLEA